MARRIHWHGTTDEALQLLHCLQVHCECAVEDGKTISTCASHAMLVDDQRALDGLLFMRRMAERLLAEEFQVAPDHETVVVSSGELVGPVSAAG